MKITTVYDNNCKAYLVANDSLAENFSKKIMDEFMQEQNENNFIFIAYRVKDYIILLHFKALDKATDFCSAIQLVKEDILQGDLCTDDENLQKALEDPQATTAKFLLDFIALEE